MRGFVLFSKKFFPLIQQPLALLLCCGALVGCSTGSWLQNRWERVYQKNSDQSIQSQASVQESQQDSSNPKEERSRILFEKGLAAEMAGDFAQARLEYQKALQAGSPYAAYQLGDMIIHGHGDHKNTMAAALSYFEQASLGGLSKADVLLGDSYFLGRGTLQSFEKAALAYERAAQAHHPYALYMLSIFYKEGLGVEQDLEKSVRAYFQAEALSANADAQYRIGRWYQRGEGFIRSPAEALVWIERAAHKGEPRSLVLLGDFYREGKVVPRDYALALALYYKAQKKGSAYAEYNIGMMFYNGEGVKPNLIEAARWFSIAAKHGAEHGQYRLAQMFYEGAGVPQDDVQAFAWWSLSAQHKVEGSQTPQLKHLIERMSPEQQKAALELAQHYREKYGGLLEAPEE